MSVILIKSYREENVPQQLGVKDYREKENVPQQYNEGLIIVGARETEFPHRDIVAARQYFNTSFFNNVRFRQLRNLRSGRSIFWRNLCVQYCLARQYLVSGRKKGCEGEGHLADHSVYLWPPLLHHSSWPSSSVYLTL